MSYKVFGLFFALVFGMISGCSNPADLRWEKIRETSIAICEGQRYCAWNDGGESDDCEMIAEESVERLTAWEEQALEMGCEEEFEVWFSCYTDPRYVEHYSWRDPVDCPSTDFVYSCQEKERTLRSCTSAM